jgi:hypothetical protein
MQLELTDNTEISRRDNSPYNNSNNINNSSTELTWTQKALICATKSTLMDVSIIGIITQNLPSAAIAGGIRLLTCTTEQMANHYIANSDTSEATQKSLKVVLPVSEVISRYVIRTSIFEWGKNEYINKIIVATYSGLQNGMLHESTIGNGNNIFFIELLDTLPSALAIHKNWITGEQVSNAKINLLASAAVWTIYNLVYKPFENSIKVGSNLFTNLKDAFDNNVRDPFANTLNSISEYLTKVDNTANNDEYSNYSNSVHGLSEQEYCFKINREDEL